MQSRYDSTAYEFIEGKTEVDIPGIGLLTFKRLKAEGEVDVSRTYARSYAAALDDGLKPFRYYEDGIRERCESAGLDYELLYRKGEIFQKLFESEKYFELKARMNELDSAEYNKKLAELIGEYVSPQRVEELNKVEAFYKRYYKLSAEYFASMEALKRRAQLCVFRPDGSPYFPSAGAFEGVETNELAAVLYYVRNLFSYEDSSAFFFI